MELSFLPEPKTLAPLDTGFTLPARTRIGLDSWKLSDAARLAGDFLRRPSVNVSLPQATDSLTLAVDKRLKPGGYRLRIDAAGIVLTGQTPAAVSHGLQTLRQVVEQAGDNLPGLEIDDWPDFADRGVYYDVCRGRVPTLSRLLELADQLARYKINQLQLYIEHTFAFRGHPKIGAGASPLSADDILTLDAHCAARGIELVPSLASFGHLATVLRHREYRHLAEDKGVGKFVAPKDEMPAWFNQKAWTLSPAVPDVYTFLDSLFAEFLPLFRSDRFNICCDETWDLGLGQSYELCKAKGKGVVYLKHIKKVRKLCKKYDKKVMFWGDIIRHYPELIDDIPSDVTVLDWGYGRNHPFKAIKDFKKAGLPFYACPGTSSWRSLFPRLPEATANIHGFAAAGKKYGADGLLNTDWGDGGHFNFMEFSWHGYLFGAEQSWNVSADRASFTRRFAERFLACGDPELVGAIDALGEISFLGGPCYQSVWLHIFFAKPIDDILGHETPVDLVECLDGVVESTRKPLDAKLAAAYLKRLTPVRASLADFADKREVDPLGVLPYWVFAADTIAFAAKKLSLLGPGGKDTAAKRRALAAEMEALAERFEHLWMARNRRSEIRITLNNYKQAIAAL